MLPIMKASSEANPGGTGLKGYNFSRGLVMTPSFSAEIVSAFTDKECIRAEDLPHLLEKYIAWRVNVPGAPEPHELKEEHARTVRAYESFQLDRDKCWDTFHSRVAANAAAEAEVQNPWLAYWFNKTPDKLSTWNSDTGKLSPKAQNDINMELRRCSPTQSASVEELLDLAPLKDDPIFNSVIDCLTDYVPYFVMNMGEDEHNPDFRWSRALCMLAGLGSTGLRRFARYIQHNSNEDAWGHWAECSDTELKQDILKARAICLYPFGLLRTSYPVIARSLNAETSLTAAPKWLDALLITHIVKHTRYYPDYNGTPALFAAYRGDSTVIALNDELMSQPFGASCHIGIMNSLCSVLDIRLGAAKDRTLIQSHALRMMRSIHPTWLPRPLALSSYTDLIPPPNVTFGRAMEKRSEYKWVDPGLVAKNISVIDVQTGVVSQKAAISGAKSLSLAWPRSPNMKQEEIAGWYGNIPAKVEPELPSTILFRYIRNINTLGCTNALKALIDGTMILSLIRPQLAGSEIGRTLDNEFPIFCVMPMEGTKETTTNQGKTTVARILGGALVPGLRAVQAVRNSSPPSQRAMAHTLETYGTAIYDEFLLPQGHDHFLNQAGLQLLATGGTATPGKALENSPGVRLRYPLFLNSKVCAFPPDIWLRLLPVYMDTLHPGNSCSSRELSLIASGAISMQIRLSALRLIEEYDIVEQLRGGYPKIGPWRFSAHLAVAEALNGRLYEIGEYFERAKKQSTSQLVVAGESGLADDIGVNVSFDAKWYFDGAREQTLEVIYQTSQVQPLRLNDVLRTLVEDQGRRTFDSALRQYNMRERSAITRFQHQLETDKGFERPGWRLEYVPSSKSTVKDERSRPVAHVKLTKLGVERGVELVMELGGKAEGLSAPARAANA